MKTPLDSIIATLHKQNVVVSRARNAYLTTEAERKNFESRLSQAAEGKSQAEKLMNAQATEEWLVFHKKLARLKSIFDFEQSKFEILDKEYLAQYQEIKGDGVMIKRQGA